LKDIKNGLDFSQKEYDRMKTLKIGRDVANDIVITDSKVSRNHLQISNEDGHFTITDLGSTNGTFVNGCKIDGEIEICVGDIIKIGNTVLTWEKFFEEEKINKTGNTRFLWLIAGVIAILAIFAVAGLFILRSKTPEQQEVVIEKIIVKMYEKDGVRYVPVKINGQELDFVFDTGASDICISLLEAYILLKNGTLKEEDIIGSQQFMTASGDIAEGTRIKLKSVQIGNKLIENVEATVVDNMDAACLLGQSVLSQFGKYTIDNQSNEIIFE